MTTSNRTGRTGFCRAARSLTAALALVMALSSIAFAGTADPSTGDWTESVTKTGDVAIAPGAESTGHFTIGDKPAYCALPGWGAMGTGKTKTYAARRVLPSDFANDQLYRGAIAALYYGPGGPGYESLGRSLFPTTGPGGSSVSTDNHYVLTHFLIGYYYQHGDWRQTFTIPAGTYDGQGSDDFFGDGANSAFYAWGREYLIPTSGYADPNTLAGRFNAHANDNEMIAHGGFSFDSFAQNVVLVMGDSSGSQDFLWYNGAQPSKGTLSLSKRSAHSSITQDNSCYDIDGARYGVFTSRADAERGRPSDAVYVGTTGQRNADGSQQSGLWKSGELSSGSYFVRELQASSGFSLDGTIYAVTVKPGSDTRVNSTYVTEEPIMLTVSAIAAKRDAETAQNAPQGKAALAGTQFTVRYYAGLHPASSLPDEATRTWVVKTGADGRALLDQDHLVSGSQLFKNGSGKVCLPLGTISIVETKAPAGYNLDDGSGGKPKVHVAQIKVEDGKATLTPLNYSASISSTNAPLVSDSVKRIGFKVSKIDSELQSGTAQGDAHLAGTVFEVINDNENDVLVDGTVYGPGEVCAQVSAESTSEGCFASMPGDGLPFGDYTIREASAPEGYRANGDWSAKISSGSSTPDGKLFDFTGSPCADSPIRGGLSVEKIDHESGSASPLGNARLEGAVIQVILESEQTVLVDGNLFNKGDVVMRLETDADGTASTGPEDLPYATYVLKEEQAPAGYLPNADWQQTVQVRAQGPVQEVGKLEDQVKRGDITLNKVAAGTQKRIGNVAFLVTSKTTGESHVVVADANGTLDTSSSWAPHSVRTNANDAALTTGQEAVEDDSGTITVRETLAQNILESTAVESSESEPDSEAEPTDVEADEPDEASSPQEDGADADDDPQRESAETPEGGIQADEADAAGMSTAATDGADDNDAESPDDAPGDEGKLDESENAEKADEGNEGSESASENRRYEVDAEKLDAETGVWFSGASGSATEPDDSRGALPYDTYTFRELSSPANDGFELVTFDVNVYRDEQLIDMGTVSDTAIPPEQPEEPPVQPEPRIGTYLSTSDGGKVAAIDDGTVTLLDRVDYTGLTPGSEYLLTGILHLRQDGKDLGVFQDAAGSPVTATQPFTPALPNGTVTVRFSFPVTQVSGIDLVAFEELSLEGETIATHADISDDAQSVSVKAPDVPEPEPEPQPEPEPEPEKPTPAQPEKKSSSTSGTPGSSSTSKTAEKPKGLSKTGDDTRLIVVPIAVLAIVAGSAAFLAWRTRRPDDLGLKHD